MVCSEEISDISVKCCLQVSGSGENRFMIDFGFIIVFKLIGVIVLYLFLPLTALTYYFSRRPRRVAELERILSILGKSEGVREVRRVQVLNLDICNVLKREQTSLTLDKKKKNRSSP